MKLLLAIVFILVVSVDASADGGSDRDVYGGVTSLQGQKTGWFHVEQIHERWFFITPEGNACFSLGVTHTGETIKQDELNHIAETYYECIVTELRRVDPHHLILGDRFMAANKGQRTLKTPDSILQTAAKYVDVISFQPMGTPQLIKPYLEEVYQLTGKPILLADVNTMTMHPTRGQADTTEYEQAAGEHTFEHYLDAASHPACIGIHRCTIRDFQPWNIQFHRRGLLQADDSPYPILIEFTKRTNQRVLDLVYGSVLNTDKKDLHD